jgi:hypothetical protein
MAAVAFEVMGALRPEAPRQLDVAGGDAVGDPGRRGHRVREAGQGDIGGAVQNNGAVQNSSTARGPAWAMARGPSAASPGAAMALPVSATASSGSPAVDSTAFCLGADARGVMTVELLKPQVICIDNFSFIL